MVTGKKKKLLGLAHNLVLVPLSQSSRAQKGDIFFYSEAKFCILQFQDRPDFSTLLSILIL